MKYLVRFTEVHEVNCESLVEADTKEEAMSKARAGDCIEEFETGNHECMEIIPYSAKKITEEQSIKWLKDNEENYTESMN